LSATDETGLGKLFVVTTSLTPALSPGEGESFAAFFEMLCDGFGRTVSRQPEVCRQLLLLLLGGEAGRGAGVKTDFSGARPSGRFNVRKLKVVEKIGRHGALGVEAV
jgi:hypothetical protein